MSSFFGDVDPAEFTSAMLENLAAFVTDRGGGMVFIAGPRFTPLAYRDTPLARLIPFDLNTAAAPHPDRVLDQPFQIRPTRLGIGSPQLQLGDNPGDSLRIWQRLAGIYWLLEAPDRKPGTRVLAEHPTRTGNDGSNLPVILLSYAGAGKVIFHASDETYRWRFRVGDVYFARYWIQTLRYLSRSKLLAQNNSAELSSDRDEYRRGDMVRLRVRFFDDRLAPPQDDGSDGRLRAGRKQATTNYAAPRRHQPRHLRRRGGQHRRRAISCLGGNAHARRPTAGSPILGRRSAGRTSPARDGRRRSKTSGQSFRRPLLHDRHCRPTQRRFAPWAARADSIVARDARLELSLHAAVVRSLAGTDDLRGADHDRMAAAKASGDAVAEKTRTLPRWCGNLSRLLADAGLHLPPTIPSYRSREVGF